MFFVFIVVLSMKWAMKYNKQINLTLNSVGYLQRNAKPKERGGPSRISLDDRR
jgi:hypothetical protein